MIQVQNLNKTYDRRRAGENHVLHDISFSLPDTGFVCILGPSGCGKTSLLNALGGLDEFDNGTISVGDVTVNRYGTPQYESQRNRNFGYIFQNYYLLPEHSVGYNVYLGLHSVKLTHKEKIRRVKEALKAVEMDRYIRRSVAELSGGQQQRVAIARALARKPRVIFADEPTGNLDEANTLNICSLLRQISKTSLVIMVTHEERIARFFADRIITLDSGRLTGIDSSWQRENLSVGSVKTIYTGDYKQTDLQADSVSLRIFQQEGVAPVKISVVALKDRIVIKLDDPRAISCGPTADSPALVEGPWPVLTLEEVDSRIPEQNFLAETTGNQAAVCSLTFSDLVTEARHMNYGNRLRSFGTRLFLVLLAILLTFSVADLITLSHMDPEDFITTHSSVLEVTIERGPRSGSSTDNLQVNARNYKNYISRTDLDYDQVPAISYQAIVSGNLILQASKIKVVLKDCSFAPMSYLPEETLIMGHMPENASQIVVDRWVLDKVLSQDGVAQNSIPGIEYFLDKQVQFGKLKASPTIVGICDSGEPAVYMSDEMFASIGTSGTEVISLSSFQKLYPGKFDGVVLSPSECIVLPVNAGDMFWDMLGSEFKTICGSTFTIAMVSDIDDCYAKIVVADDQIDDLMLNMSMKTFWVYCSDKAAMTAHLEKAAKRFSDAIDVTVTDHYAQKTAQFHEASRLRADGRTIIISTVILLSAVMLYLLRRSDVHGKIGMLSVYRLLGIPSRKAIEIFAIESMLSCAYTVLPAVTFLWALLGILNARDMISMVLPWYGAVGIIAGILIYQLFVTWLPLRSLLKLPPARLAAKYDF